MENALPGGTGNAAGTTPAPSPPGNQPPSVTDRGDREDPGLAAELALSFPFSRDKFRTSYPALLARDDACLLVAVNGHDHHGYVLGFSHLTFYANGPVAWVEELVVRGSDRGHGIGRALMSAFERWAAARECVLIALATRRAAPFYRALGYEESATYYRKVLASQPY